MNPEQLSPIVPFNQPQPEVFEVGALEKEFLAFEKFIEENGIAKSEAAVKEVERLAERMTRRIEELKREQHFKELDQRIYDSLFSQRIAGQIRYGGRYGKTAASYAWKLMAKAGQKGNEEHRALAARLLEHLSLKAEMDDQELFIVSNRTYGRNSMFNLKLKFNEVEAEKNARLREKTRHSLERLNNSEFISRAKRAFEERERFYV